MLDIRTYIHITQWVRVIATEHSTPFDISWFSTRSQSSRLSRSVSFRLVCDTRHLLVTLVSIAFLFRYCYIFRSIQHE